MTRRFLYSIWLTVVSLSLSCAASRGSAAPSFTVDKTKIEYGVEVQELTYVSDGLHVKGILFFPPGSGTWPGVVFNHGGVSGISRDMVRRSADLARAGYVVLTPAYRGEGGSEGVVEVAAGEVNDVLQAAEILRASPRVDAERIALIGSSHGALISILAAGRDPRFQAVASACGVMDVVAWYQYLLDNGFDVTDSLSRAVYGYGPQDKPEAFRVRNATLVAPKFKPPLLLQQGSTDRTVPADQPWRMAAALKRAGHERHQVLTYPLLGHAFWFYNDPKNHPPERLAQAEQSWQDLLTFLGTHLQSGAQVSRHEPNIDPVDRPPPATPYHAAIYEWQDRRRQRLLADDGWLTVSGLFWLEEGDNRLGSDPGGRIVLPGSSIPAVAGTIRLDHDQVTLRANPERGHEPPRGVVVPAHASLTYNGEPVSEMKLTSDADGKPEVLSLGDYRFFLIKRSKGYAIRVRDLNSPARRNFAGIEMFPVDSTWRVEARYVPYDPPKPVEIPNIIGTVDTMPAPGYVEFTKDGRTWRLDPVLESPDSDELFFIFKDLTSGVETYPPGRFLYTPLPVDGRVTLDFNRAYNPPCAFTDFATCPLPPDQNALTLKVTAGEKRYAGH